MNTRGVHFLFFYNIPGTCLPNTSPVQAMVLKSNRSGLWHHIIETCRRLRWLCRKHSNNVARHDKIPVKSILLSRGKDILSHDTSLMSRRCDIMLWLYTFRSCNRCIFSLTTCAVLRPTTYLLLSVWYIGKHLFYETAWSILCWSQKNDVTSLVKVRILHTKFDHLCNVISKASK